MTKTTSPRAEAWKDGPAGGTLRWAITAGLLALLVAGCGAGSRASGRRSATDPTAPRTAGGEVTRSQLLARADAICKRVNEEFASTKPASQSVQEVLRIVPRRAALEQQAVVKLGALKPPPALAITWRAIVSERATLARELSELALYAKQDNVAAMRALSVSKARMHGRLHATATLAGFDSCGVVG